MLETSLVYLKELTNIQSRLNAPKTQKNKAMGYNYRNAEDILLAVKPLLVENNAQIIISDSVEVYGADRFYIKATATFVCQSGKISCSAYAREPLARKGLDEAQVTGATSSYARKYALNGLLLIDDNKDPDHGNVHEGNVVSKSYGSSKKISPPALNVDGDSLDIAIKVSIDSIADNFVGIYQLCQGLSELKDLFSAVWTALAKHKNSYAADKMANIKQLYDKKKEELTIGDNKNDELTSEQSDVPVNPAAPASA